MPTTGTELGYAPLGMPAVTNINKPPPPNKILSNYIDPQKRDYIVSATGEYATMPVVRQKMLLALISILGSSSVLPNYGNDPPRKIDDAYKRNMENSVRLATKFITDAKEARIDSVIIETFGPRGDSPKVIVSYTDLTTGLSDTLEV